MAIESGGKNLEGSYPTGEVTIFAVNRSIQDVESSSDSLVSSTRDYDTNDSPIYTLSSLQISQTSEFHTTLVTEAEPTNFTENRIISFLDSKISEKTKQQEFYQESENSPLFSKTKNISDDESLVKYVQSHMKDQMVSPTAHPKDYESVTKSPIDENDFSLTRNPGATVRSPLNMMSKTNRPITIRSKSSNIRTSGVEPLTEEQECRLAQEKYLRICSPPPITGIIPSYQSCETLSLTSTDEGSSVGSQGNCSPQSCQAGSPTSSYEKGNLNEADDYAILDRFGFVVGNRHISVPPGVTSSRDADGVSDKESVEGRKRALKEAARAVKWVKMLQTIDEELPFYIDYSRGAAYARAHRKFERRLVKGIPECMRSHVWGRFLGLQAGRTDEGVIASPQEKDSFRKLYMKISGFERQIDLDIERTLRDHVLFKARFSSAQVSLFKVLVAYSNLDREVGYCQGMSTIAAFLLLYFDEEVAFAALRRLLERDSLRTMYVADFPMLFEFFHVQETLMKSSTPRLSDQLRTFGIETSVYATKWYLTMYLGCLPFPLATRVWDLLLLWGPDVLVCVAVSLLQHHSRRLLRLEYEPCMQALARLPESPLDEDNFMKDVWNLWASVGAVSSKCGGASVISNLRSNYGKHSNL